MGLRVGLGSPESDRLGRALLGWYDTHGRELPWRTAPADPWRVLVSELMLQQTMVATVKGRFGPFLARFPSIEALAAAPLDDVLHAWQGLGYYRRARALHACAQAVVERHGGRLPGGEAELRALPGIGPYTAAAVQAIAHARPVVPVDGNVRRVLARLLGLAAAPIDREIAAAAAAIARDDRPGDLAQALMDLGAMVCTPRRPACPACPWHDDCRSRAAGIQDRVPPRAEKPARPIRRGIAFLLQAPDGAILFRRRPDRGLLGGMVELPGTPWAEAMPHLPDALAHAPPDGGDWHLLDGHVRHVFTHLTLELGVVRGHTRAPVPGLWCRPAGLHRLALPALTRRLLRHAGVPA